MPSETTQPTPAITVIVAAHNVERYLDECLLSISGQTFGDFECVVIDDGSTDASGQIADAVAANDPRFCVVHQENRGISAARNVGLGLARGDFVAFVDGDDVCLPEMLERLRACAIETGSPIAICDYFDYREDPSGAGSMTSTPRHSFGELSTKALDERQFWQLFYARDLAALIYPWNKLYRRELFEAERFIEGLRYEDSEIAHRLVARAASVVIMDEPLYLYRRHSASYTGGQRPAHYLDLCEALVIRGGHFARRGWQDLVDENALYLISRVARTRQGVELCGERDQGRYAEYRALARDAARGLLRRHWREGRYATRALAFLLGEGFYMRLVKARAATPRP